jgi:hypothetical protein
MASAVRLRTGADQRMIDGVDALSQQRRRQHLARITTCRVERAAIAAEPLRLS